MIWGYLLSFVGMLGFYLAGRKLWWAWYVNIANQVLWVVYSIITDQRGFLIGAGFYTVIFVKNAINWTRDHNREKEKKRKHLDELDYNRIVMPCNRYSEKYYEYCILDSDHNSQAVNAPIFHQGAKYMWLQTAVDLPADVNLISDEEFQFERNARQYQAEAKLTAGVTRESRGYGIMAGQCNNLNTDESYPYYCVRHKSHIHHVDPKVRRHGYAGVFWD